jgi:hypothetical protein
MTRGQPSNVADVAVEVPAGRPGGGNLGAGGELTGAPGLPIPVLEATLPCAEPCYVMTPIDRDGRLADRSVLALLGWVVGTAVALDVEPGPIVIGRSGRGIHVDRRGHLRLPLALRRTCRITSGDRLLLAAHQEAGELHVIPSWVLTRMIQARCRAPSGVDKS